MQTQKYVNAVCFVRTYEYYGNYDPANLTALQGQMALYNQHHIPATYLLEYDALQRDAFTQTVLENRKSTDEVGLWLEITGGLCASANVPWRSKRNRDWDFYVDPGCSPSYSTEEKKKLCDAAMALFHSRFGCYPRTVGAWLLDSETMEYLNTRYGMDAYIICREQWGMDGYTLWGGPYFGGYYPSKNNALTPAQSIENQLNVPVFRMYISDPIYSYYEFTRGEMNGINYHLFTQEPTWRYGQDPAWVKWCMETLFGQNIRGFSYFQLGQETSFGFGRDLERALQMQCRYAVEHKDRYQYQFVTVGQMGRQFCDAYQQTPNHFLTSAYDWANLDNHSVWYHTKRYRINIFNHKSTLWIRDIHLFDDSYRDRYLDNPCRTRKGIYDNLPIVDGVRFTQGCDDNDIPCGDQFNGKRYEKPAGIYLNAPAKITGIEYFENEICLRINHGEYRIFLREDGISIEKDMYQQFSMHFEHKPDLHYLKSINEKSLIYQHREYEYSLILENGQIQADQLISENSSLTMHFDPIIQK